MSTSIPYSFEVAVRKLQGKKYYFCTVGCRGRFAEDPEKFIKEEKQ
jgi:YHS domain-containing protein